MIIKLVKRISKRILSITLTNKLLIGNIIGSFGIKGVAAAIQLAIMPAYLQYFSDQAALGAWFAIVGVFGWFTVFDVGIGNGLRNKLAPSLANMRWVEAKKFTSSAYVVLGVGTLVLGVLCFLLGQWVNWNSLFGIPETVLKPNTMKMAAMITMLSFVASIFLRIITSVLYAAQVPVIVNLIAVMENTALLVFLWVAPSNPIDQAVWILSWMNAVCIITPSLFTTILVFSTSLRRLRPDPRDYDAGCAKEILSLGLKFFIIQVLFAVIAQNELLITHFFNPEEVVEFTVYNKIFHLVPMICSLVVTPLWSAVTKAIAQERFLWTMKLYSILWILTGLAWLLCLLVALTLNFTLSIWLGAETVLVRPEYAMTMAIFTSVCVCQTIWSTIGFGLGIVKPQMIISLCGAFLKIPVAWAVAHLIPNWTSVIVAHSIVWLPYVVLLPSIIRRAVDNLGKEERIEK